jgi:uncharacterized membrane protein
MLTKNLKLYLLVLGGMALVFAAALGGGLFGQTEPWFLQWQHKAFMQLCHQMPDRSFQINGQPMAVCSRCIGIYAGFLAGWLALPLFSVTKIGRQYLVKIMLVAAVVINLLDLAGNMLGFWENTLLSRLVLGVWAGGSGAALFRGAFFIKKVNYKEEYYGRNARISGAG